MLVGLLMVLHGLPCQLQAPRKDALGLQTTVDCRFHHVPHLGHIGHDFRGLIAQGEFPNLDSLGLAESEDLLHVGDLERIDIILLCLLLSLDDDLAATDAVVGLAGDILSVSIKRMHGQRVGMEGFEHVGEPGNLDLPSRQHFTDCRIGQMPFSCRGERAEQIGLVCRGIRMHLQEMGGGGAGTHRMAAGGAMSNTVQFTQGFHSHRWYSLPWKKTRTITEEIGGSAPPCPPERTDEAPRHARHSSSRSVLRSG